MDRRKLRIKISYRCIDVKSYANGEVRLIIE